MQNFELMYVANINCDTKKFTEEIVSEINNNGEVQKVDCWGIKRMPYECDGQTEGEYTLITFSSTSNGIKSLDSFLKKDTRNLRHMIIRKAND